MTSHSKSQARPAPVRVLELFGPSSAGKSTLAARLAAEPGCVSAEERLLARFGLAAVRGRVLRTLLVDALAALGLVLTWREAGAFYRAAARLALGGEPARVLPRLNLLRNAWKVAAIRLLAPRFAAPGETLLMDEGPLQAANYLLVHVEAPPDLAALDTLLASVPLPDAAAYVRGSEETLVARTLARTHPRVPDGSPAATARFVRHALAVFDRIAAAPRIAERLVAPEALAGARNARCEACA
jgi:hypothetical protein